MDMTTFRLRRAAAVTRRVGQQAWTTPGTYSFVVPMSVTSISAVCIGGGASGGGSNNATGGRGGGGASLRWIANLPVTPGEVLTVFVGAPGNLPQQYNDASYSGQSSHIRRASTNLLRGAGGDIAGENSTIGTVNGVTIGGGTGGNGTSGWDTNPNSGNGGGGGGAGGYSGNGGTNNLATPTGGGGGSGYRRNVGAGEIGGGGGGVGLLGEGASGGPGNATNRGGLGGSGGSAALPIDGGNFGGGGGGTGYDSIGQSGNRGGGGAVRIIWGYGRSYPSTRTADEFP